MTQDIGLGRIELVPQAQRLRDALEASGGNVSEAARQLGLSREYVHELMRTYGISIVRQVRVSPTGVDKT